MNETTKATATRLNGPSTATASNETRITLRFPFQVKQVGEREVEIKTFGVPEDPLAEACFARLREMLGEVEAHRVERKVAALLLREAITGMMEVV